MPMPWLFAGDPAYPTPLPRISFSSPSLSLSSPLSSPCHLGSGVEELDVMVSSTPTSTHNTIPPAYPPPTSSKKVRESTSTNTHAHRAVQPSHPPLPRRYVYTPQTPTKKCVERYGGKIIKSTHMQYILRIVREIMQLKTHQVLLVLDIDDTIIYGCMMEPTIVESEIKHLMEEVTDEDPNHLVFLTARQEATEDWTQGQLRDSGVVPDNIAFPYNVVYAPPDENGRSTKGEVFAELVVPYIEERKRELPDSKPIWICFLDDQYSNLASMYDALTPHADKCEFSLFYYVHVQYYNYLRKLSPEPSASSS